MPKVKAKVEGLPEVLRKLNKEIAKIKGATRGGLMAGGLIIQAESQRHTPREKGHLVGSAYTRPTPEDKMTIEVGYTKGYAVYVHENLEQKLRGEPRPSGLGVYWGPQGAGPKFLENAVKKMRRRVLQEVAKRARL